MSISFDKALGIHEQALGFRAQRAEVLANNIANADTPNYKARDLDFASVLAAQSDKNQNGAFALNKTNTRKDRKSTRLNSSHKATSSKPSSA